MSSTNRYAIAVSKTNNIILSVPAVGLPRKATVGVGSQTVPTIRIVVISTGIK